MAPDEWTSVLANSRQSSEVLDNCKITKLVILAPGHIRGQLARQNTGGQGCTLHAGQLVGNLRSSTELMRSHAKTCKRIRACKSLTTDGTGADVLQLHEHVLIACVHQMLLIRVIICMLHKNVDACVCYIRVMMHVYATLRVSHPCIEADCVALEITCRHWNAVAQRQCDNSNSRDGSGADTMSHTHHHPSQ